MKKNHQNGPKGFVPRRSWALVTDVGLVGHVSDNRDVLEQMRRGGEKIERCEIVPASVASVPSVANAPKVSP